MAILILLLIFLFIVFRKYKYFHSKVEYSLDGFLGHWFRKASRMAGFFKMDKKVARNGMKEIHGIMNKYDVFFYLSEGTAVGFTRDNNLIDGDDDVDFGLFIKDKDKFIKKVIPDLINMGFNIDQGFNNFYTLSKKGIDFDFEIVGKGIPCVTLFDDCELLIPYLQQFNKINIDGKIYNIPNTDYLIKVFGKNWKTHEPKEKKNINKSGIIKILNDSQ